MDIKLPPVKVAVNLEALHKPNAVRLDGYPLLTYAPSQHGEGIRTEDNGTPIEDIVAKLAETKDPAATARAFGTSVAHVGQAAAYAHAHGTTDPVVTKA